MQCHYFLDISLATPDLVSLHGNLSLKSLSLSKRGGNLCCLGQRKENQKEFLEISLGC